MRNVQLLVIPLKSTLITTFLLYPNRLPLLINSEFYHLPPEPPLRFHVPWTHRITMSTWTQIRVVTLVSIYLTLELFNLSSWSWLLDKSKSRWEYPSPQQFYNALLRKGWKFPEEHMEPMLQLHNRLNEDAWLEIMKWESRRYVRYYTVYLVVYYSYFY